MSSVVATLSQGYWVAASKATHFQNQNAKPLSLPLSANCNFNSKGLALPSPLFPITTKSSSFKTSVAAVEPDQLNSSDSADKEKRYYFVVANAKFMLDEEEHFKELLFERLRMYGERNKEQDFWLVVEPKFLDKFLLRPSVALVSTNGPWITFMKLRLDRVLSESYEAENLEEALASIPTKLDFDKPDKWTAPYQKYDYGWWESFLPPGSKEEAKV